MKKTIVLRSLSLALTAFVALSEKMLKRKDLKHPEFWSTSNLLAISLTNYIKEL